MLNIKKRVVFDPSRDADCGCLHTFARSPQYQKGTNQPVKNEVLEF